MRIGKQQTRLQPKYQPANEMLGLQRYCITKIVNNNNNSKNKDKDKDNNKYKHIHTYFEILQAKHSSLINKVINYFLSQTWVISCSIIILVYIYS